MIYKNQIKYQLKIFSSTVFEFIFLQKRSYSNSVLVSSLTSSIELDPIQNTLHNMSPNRLDTSPTFAQITISTIPLFPTTISSTLSQAIMNISSLDPNLPELIRKTSTSTTLYPSKNKQNSIACFFSLKASCKFAT